jgi:hypothetical protein
MLSLVVRQCQAMLDPAFVARYAGQRETRGRNSVEGMRLAAQLILELIPDEQRKEGSDD